MNTVVLFIRRGRFIPLCRSAEYTEAIDTAHLTLAGWIDASCSESLYEDDGITTDISLDDGLKSIRVNIAEGIAAASCESKKISTSKLVVK